MGERGVVLVQRAPGYLDYYPILLVGQSWVSESRFLVTNLNTGGRERSFKERLAFTLHGVKEVPSFKAYPYRAENFASRGATSFSQTPSTPSFSHLLLVLNESPRSWSFFWFYRTRGGSCLFVDVTRKLEKVLFRIIGIYHRRKCIK